MRALWVVSGLAGAAFATAAGAADGAPSSAASGAAASSTAFATLAMPLVPDLQRVELVLQKPAGDDHFNRLKGALRHRFASQMMDLYPDAASGFHASVGTRFFKRAYIRRDQELATNGLLYTPRMPRGTLGYVRGFRRATPAATFGYTELVRPNLMLGLEGGALLGRVVPVSPVARRLGSIRGDRPMRTNPVVNMTVAYAF